MTTADTALEEAAAPTGGQPIIDAHHHYWDLSLGAHPWLCELPTIPFRYGDYSALKRNFLPPEYEDAAHRHHVVATVTMEGEWDPADPVAESVWLDRLRRETGRPAAHVARAFLDEPGVESVLAGHSAYPFVKGIRHKPASAPTPDTIETGTAGGLSDPKWRRGYGALARHGLHFELQAPWWHVDELADLVAAHPETPVVINHAFMPVDRSADGLSAWSDALARAADLPNTTLKISGIGMRDRPWAYADQERVIKTCIDTFGPQRCMFASNFPVDSLCGSFDTIFTGFKQAASPYGLDGQHHLFYGTAARVYGLRSNLLRAADSPAD